MSSILTHCNCPEGRYVKCYQEVFPKFKSQLVSLCSICALLALNQLLFDVDKDTVKS